MKIEKGTVLYTWDEKEVVVTKVGKKYFYAKPDYKERQFFIESLKENSDYRPTQLYAGLQEIRDFKEAAKCHEMIRAAFPYLVYGNSKFTLEQLREVVKILEL